MKERDDDAIFLMTEMAISLVAKDAWEKKYKKALTDEDEKIARVLAEEERRWGRLLDIKTKFHTTKESAINKVAKKFMDNLCKKRGREEISKVLYQQEQRCKWKKEPTTLALRKQYATAESLKETIRRQKAITERRAREEMIDAAFARYLAEE